jgi:uncharacterized protein
MPIVTSWLSPKARKGARSPIAGRGLFAVEPIARGEVVAVKGGHVVGTHILRSLSAKLQETEIQIAEGLHLVALSDEEYDSVMLFLNHSCAPNVGVVGNIVFGAMRDIAPGEEITTDYALFDVGTAPMECSCGSVDCRGVVTGDDWNDPVLRARYDRWFSRYVVECQGGT